MTVGSNPRPISKPIFDSKTATHEATNNAGTNIANPTKTAPLNDDTCEDSHNCANDYPQGNVLTSEAAIFHISNR